MKKLGLLVIWISVPLVSVEHPKATLIHMTNKPSFFMI